MARDMAAVRNSRRVLAPAAAAVLGLCCVAVALQLRRGPAGDELVSSGCDRLCQARTMILRAKEALDNKAAAELMLLRVLARRPPQPVIAARPPPSSAPLPSA